MRDSGEGEEAEEMPPRAKLYCLLSIMPHYNMLVKSGPAGRFRKSFGNRCLGALHGGGEDAIFCGVWGGQRW